MKQSKKDKATKFAAREVLSRRLVLQCLGASSVAVLPGCSSASADVSSLTLQAFTSSNSPPTNNTATGSGEHPIFGADLMTRQTQALDIRQAAAAAQSTISHGTQQTNGDEGLYADYRASYSKGLPHNEIGEVDNGAYQALLSALGSGENNDFEAIPLGGVRKLVNPQGAFRFEMVGLDSHKSFIRPAPSFESLETAAEMGELYWKALCRDIPFAEYETSSLIQSAITDLNGFSETVGPQSSGAVTMGTVFRGPESGNLIGPYISQLLWKDIPYGSALIPQQYATPSAGADTMTDVASWLAVQRGTAPAQLTKSNARYINDARALAEYVHSDFSYQAYLNAALILLAIPNSADVGNIYNTSGTQAGFASLGGPDVLDLVAKAGNLSLSSAWYQKWLVHRRLRPETYGGRLHFQHSGEASYGLPDEVLNSDGAGRIFAQNNTYLLPQCFPEGSPTHPSYPAGHACIAGACSTILKAYFEESLIIPDTVISSADGQNLSSYFGASLTIGGEINKLANNIALGRNWAGVHYRSDGTDGLLVGEQQAISLLLDYSRTYNEQFNGFTLTKFDGEQITIQNGVIT